MTEYIEQFWSDATAAHVVRVMDGEEVEARFRDSDKQAWENSRLWGWQGHLPYKWIKSTGSPYYECQVYDPPQWWLDRPDPEEEYRLLSKFPDEDLQPGDEFFADGHWWVVFVEAPYPQVRGVWYRRKIEQPKPEPKFQVGQRVRIAGPKERPGAIWERAMDQYIGHDGTLTSLDYVSGRWFCQIADAIVWSFHEDYLEAVVEAVVEPEPKHYVLQVGDTAELPDGSIVKALELGMEVQ